MHRKIAISTGFAGRSTGAAYSVEPSRMRVVAHQVADRDVATSALVRYLALIELHFQASVQLNCLPEVPEEKEKESLRIEKQSKI